MVVLGGPRLTKAARQIVHRAAHHPAAQGALESDPHHSADCEQRRHSPIHLVEGIPSKQVQGASGSDHTGQGHLHVTHEAERMSLDTTAIKEPTTPHLGQYCKQGVCEKKLELERGFFHVEIEVRM